MGLCGMILFMTYLAVLPSTSLIVQPYGIHLCLSLSTNFGNRNHIRFDEMNLQCNVTNECQVGNNSNAATLQRISIKTRTKGRQQLSRLHHPYTTKSTTTPKPPNSYHRKEFVSRNYTCFCGKCKNVDVKFNTYSCKQPRMFNFHHGERAINVGPNFGCAFYLDQLFRFQSSVFTFLISGRRSTQFVFCPGGVPDGKVSMIAFSDNAYFETFSRSNKRLRRKSAVLSDPTRVTVVTCPFQGKNRVYVNSKPPIELKIFTKPNILEFKLDVNNGMSPVYFEMVHQNQDEIRHIK